MASWRTFLYASAQKHCPPYIRFGIPERITPVTSLNPLDGINAPLPPQMTVTKRAVLIFADNLVAHLARRRLPRKAEGLLSGHRAVARLRGADVHLFTTGISEGDPDDRVHGQAGTTFAERIENATATLASLGYAEIVMIGRDCPELCEDDISIAFAQLESKRVVIGPDHRGGCYLIAFRTIDRQLLRGICWQRNTDCAQLLAHCATSEVTLLAVKHDVDSLADVRLIARGGGWAGSIARLIVAVIACGAAWSSCAVDRLARFMRIQHQLPPPAFAA